MIKETVNEYRFRDVLMADEYAGWSYGACRALFEYYEQLSEDTGEDIELDPVAIRCEWNEFDTLAEAYDQYSPEEDSGEKTEAEMREWLEERSTVLDVENIDTTADTYKTIKSFLLMSF